ncbi:hypothetical protein ABOM_002800 [Aspergillus bombycis]|uniref:Uncharacterized protein n=1 Tax=Aspergillus bombycis TaxID=109264 RepID=A0A1F8A8M7_9EURO|nr:hypothetical protein ABOM_002800 [Aspergillus bombycis]OGM48074.1 hypothetical protein ABOM_002800 [Aspergillus bombycis]
MKPLLSRFLRSGAGLQRHPPTGDAERGGISGASAVIGRGIADELCTLYGLKLTKSNVMFVERSRKQSGTRVKRKGFEIDFVQFAWLLGLSLLDPPLAVITQY